MSPDTEQRHYNRDNDGLPMVFTDWRSNNFYTAVMLNHSTGGISFKSKFPVEPGSDVLVTIKGNEQQKEGYRSRGVVIWCRKIPEEDVYKYAIGAQYYEQPNSDL